MNTLMLFANLVVSQMQPPHHSVIPGVAFVDNIGTITYDALVIYNTDGLYHDGTTLKLNPSVTAGIAAASGAIASLSSTVSSHTNSLSTLSTTVGQNSTDITVLQSAVAGISGGAVGATNGVGAATGQVGEFIQSCRAKGSAVTISGTTTLHSLSLSAGVWLVSATPTETGSLVGTSFAGAIAVNSTTMPTQAAAGGAARQETPVVASLGADSGLNIVSQPVFLSSAGTVNVLATTTLSIGTASGYACASALRIH